MSTKFPKKDLEHAVDVYHMRSWRNWQTRQIQVLVGATRWRFKSSRAHQRKPLIYQGFSPFLYPFDALKISTKTSLKSGRRSVDRIRTAVFGSLTRYLLFYVTDGKSVLVSLLSVSVFLVFVVKTVELLVSELLVGLFFRPEGESFGYFVGGFQFSPVFQVPIYIRRC